MGNSMRPVELALIAWSRDKESREHYPKRREDAKALGETGVFSNRNIAHITGLDVDTVGKITGKRSKTGGRLNPEAIPTLWEAEVYYRVDSYLAVGLIKVAINMGVSPRMAAKLIGVPPTTLYTALRGQS